jgi:site-specific DNA-methyltransferase (adenine-specific)
MVQIIHDHVLRGLRKLPQGSVQTVITSPPYWKLRTYLCASEDERLLWSGEKECAPYGNEAQLVCRNARDPEQLPCGDCYVCRTLKVFEELRRVLREDGTIWWNVGDTFSEDGSPHLIPLILAEALNCRGWLVRSLVVWAKQIYEEHIENTVGRALPESIGYWRWKEGKDGQTQLERRRWRPNQTHEYLLFVVKRSNGVYFSNLSAIAPQRYYSRRWSTQFRHPAYRRMNGIDKELPADRKKNVPSVWRISPGNTETMGAKSRNQEQHIAVMPLKLAELCVRVSTSPYGRCSLCGAPILADEKKLEPRRTCTHDSEDAQPMLVLDPFSGSGTTGVAAVRNGCDFVGVEWVKEYVQMSERRLAQEQEQQKLRL